MGLGLSKSRDSLGTSTGGFDVRGSHWRWFTGKRDKMKRKEKEEWEKREKNKKYIILNTVKWYFCDNVKN